MNNWQKGQAGEDRALEDYTLRGYKLVQKNFQYYSKGSQGRKGEVDLILEINGILVFVEVKNRDNTKFGKAIEQITASKVKHLFFSYQYFIKKFPSFKNYNARIDIACIDNGVLEITENAVSF